MRPKAVVPTRADSPSYRPFSPIGGNRLEKVSATGRDANHGKRWQQSGTTLQSISGLLPTALSVARPGFAILGSLLCAAVSSCLLPADLLEPRFETFSTLFQGGLFCVQDGQLSQLSGAIPRTAAGPWGGCELVCVRGKEPAPRAAIQGTTIDHLLRVATG